MESESSKIPPEFAKTVLTTLTHRQTTYRVSPILVRLSRSFWLMAYARTASHSIELMRLAKSAGQTPVIIHLKSSLRQEHAQLVIAISGQMLLMPLKTAFKTIATPHKMKFTGAMALAHHALTTLTQVNISTKQMGKVSASPILATTQPKFF